MTHDCKCTCFCRALRVQRLKKLWCLPSGSCRAPYTRSPAPSSNTETDTTALHQRRWTRTSRTSRGPPAGDLSCPKRRRDLLPETETVDQHNPSSWGITCIRNYIEPGILLTYYSEISNNIDMCRIKLGK